MTRWEYKSVRLERAGTKEDFSFTWTYTPWELSTDKSGKQPLDPALRELGNEGWELAGVIPSDLWSEAGRPNSSHGVRAISCILVFKRQLEDAG
jgi:hypothetical protein